MGSFTVDFKSVHGDDQAPPDERPQGYERVVSVVRDPEYADGMALIGLWYDDRAAPSDEVAAEMLREFHAEG